MLLAGRLWLDGTFAKPGRDVYDGGGAELGWVYGVEVDVLGPTTASSRDVWDPEAAGIKPRSNDWGRR